MRAFLVKLRRAVFGKSGAIVVCAGLGAVYLAHAYVPMCVPDAYSCTRGAHMLPGETGLGVALLTVAFLLLRR